MTACTSNIPSSQATQHAPFGQKQQTRSSCVSKAKCLATNFRLPTKIKGKQKITKNLLSQRIGYIHSGGDGVTHAIRQSCWGERGFVQLLDTAWPPPLHTHTENVPSTLCTLPLPCTSLYLSPHTQRSAIPKVPSSLCTSTHYLYPVVPSTLYLFTSVQYVQR